MRYMRWSYPDMMACPHSYLEVIAEVARSEADAAQSARASARRR